MALGITLVAILCMFVIAPSSPASAADNSASQSIAQAFKIAKGDEITTGALVSTQAKDPKTVELATTSTAGRLIGVVDTYPLLVISDNEEGAHVVISGTTYILVSDINGPISAGDKITASPIAGVGMRATIDSQVVGSALGGLTIKSTQTRTIKDSHGSSRMVHIGMVPLQIGIAFYQAPGSNFLPPFVQRVANAITGRNVSLTRVLVSSLLILISFISITVLVYTVTRSAMISLGRNPLAAHDIRRSLYQALVVAGVAAAVTLLAAYLILAV
jgi:hypothetical protein